MQWKNLTVQICSWGIAGMNMLTGRVPGVHTGQGRVLICFWSTNACTVLLTGPQGGVLLQERHKYSLEHFISVESDLHHEYSDQRWCSWSMQVCRNSWDTQPANSPPASVSISQSRQGDIDAVRTLLYCVLRIQNWSSDELYKRDKLAMNKTKLHQICSGFQGDSNDLLRNGLKKTLDVSRHKICFFFLLQSLNWRDI